MGVVQMETHEFTEIATFQAGKGTRSSDRRDLLNRSSSLFENVVATDVRTFAAGYSETIEPIWIPHAGLTSYRPVQSPQDITVFIATCTDIQQTQTKINESYNEYTYTYTYSVDEFCYLEERLLRIDTIKYEENFVWTKKQVREPLLEIGKSYLVWGHYYVNTDGSAIIWCPLGRGATTAERTVEQNGKHILTETSSGNLTFVPLVSELNVSPEEFWQTEMGQIWQETIMAKIPICRHSISVVGTNNLESIYAFNQKICRIVSGDIFDELQYKEGERVCIISEELAQINGLAVGDIIPLKLYDADYQYEHTYGLKYRDSFDTEVGFTEEGSWRIIGIYHTDYATDQHYVIHPNVIFVPNNSMYAYYTSYYTPLMSISYILPEGGWETFEEEAISLGYAGCFVYGDGGKSEVLEENNRRQTALTEWQSAVETWCKPLPTVSTVLMAVAMLVFVLSKKKEIGRLYAIETSNRMLFLHFFVQTIIVGALAFGLALLLASPILSRVVPTVLRDLADPAYADLLMAGIPEESLSWTPILGKQVLIYTVISAICAAIGAGRRYQFEYHN